MADTIMNLLGLGRRAGNLISGDMAVRTAIAKRQTKLIILSKDAADRTKKAFRELAHPGNIPIIDYSTKIELGCMLNKPPRSVLAVLDQNLARGILRALERGEAH